MYCDCMKVKVLIVVEVVGNVVELGMVKFEMVGRTRKGGSKRNEELESVREELREVRRESRETV